MIFMKQQDKDGFTIVEVMLVLGIGGLIFLMVFLALPSLNRAQRDSRRRDDIAILLRKIKDYQTNNRGALPTGSGTVSYGESSGDTSWASFYHDYLGNKFEDPLGDKYVLSIKKCGAAVGSVCSHNMTEDNTTFPNGYTILLSQQATCDGSQVVASKNTRKVAVQYMMEGVGVYCAGI